MYVIILIIFVIIIMVYYFIALRKRNRKPEFILYDTDSESIAKSIAELKWKYKIDKLLPEHLLFAILNKPGDELNNFFSGQRIDIEEIKKDLSTLFEKRVIIDREMNDKVSIGKYLEEIIDNINKRKYTRITPPLLFESLLLKIINSKDSIYEISREVLRKKRISPEYLLLEIQNILNK